MLTGRGTGFRDAGVGAEMKLPKTVTAEAKSVSTNMTRDCPFPLRRVATKKDGVRGDGSQNGRGSPSKRL